MLMSLCSTNLSEFLCIFLYRSFFLASLFPSEFVAEFFVAFYAEDGEAAVLCGFGEAEEYYPKDSFGGCADGQSHLRKRQYIKRYARYQYNHSRAERQRREPSLHFGKYFFDGFHNGRKITAKILHLQINIAYDITFATDSVILPTKSYLFSLNHRVIFAVSEGRITLGYT